MPGFENVKHGKCVVELKAVYAINSQNKPPELVSPGIKYLSGDDLSLGRSTLAKPFPVAGDPHQIDFDRMIFFPRRGANDAIDFNAEIEFTLEH
jgi:hypothetical protein